MDSQLIKIILASFRQDCEGLKFSDEWTEIDAFREWFHDAGQAIENELGN